MIAANSSISIEFGHFSFEESFDNFNLRLADEARIIDSIARRYSSHPIHKIVLIDDYNNNIHPKYSESYNEYIKAVSDLGVQTLGFESRFSEIAKNFIENIQLEKFYEKNKDAHICYASYNDLKIKLYTNYEQPAHFVSCIRAPKYSCSVLTACWYLCRLNVLKYPEKSLHPIADIKRIAAKSSSNYLFNILPMKYKKVECKTQALLLNSQYRKVLPQIKNFFYESNLC